MEFLSDLLKVSRSLDKDELYRFAELLHKYRDNLAQISDRLYKRFCPEQQQRFVAWFLKRWAKIDILSHDELEQYQNIVRRSFARYGEECIDGKTYVLRRYDYAGYDFSLLGYDWFTGVHDIYFDQYASRGFDVRPGDVIIDGGAFIGDSAVLFDAKTGGNCEIHAFELFDENLKLLQRNLQHNGLMDRVFVNRLALGDASDIELSIGVTRLQASMSLMYPGSLKVKMVRLDDYVKERGLTRVDFIKFDIEGAEIPALEGARETIERFRPRMALCLYHKWDDVLTIPAFLDSLSFDYDYEFKWVQLKLGTEGVILLTPRAQARTDSPAVLEASPGVGAALHALDAYRQEYARSQALWMELQAQMPVTLSDVRREADRIVLELQRGESLGSAEDRLLLLSRAGTDCLSLPLECAGSSIRVVLPVIGEAMKGRWDVWLESVRGEQVIGRQRVFGSAQTGRPRHFINERFGDYGISAYLTESESSLALYVDEGARHERVCAEESARHNFPNYLRDLPLREDLVLFESFLGKAYAGNPRYIYEVLRQLRPDLKCVWSYNGETRIPGDPQIVRRGSAEYFQLLAQAKYRVNNIRFPVCGKKDETVYLQTWHGTPLKRLGYDIEVDGPEVAARDALYRESRSWSLLLSENPYSSMALSRAFRYDGQVLEAGYPLTDVLLEPFEEQSERLQKLGLPTGRRFILYAPTWRDDQALGAWQHRFDLRLDLEQLSAGLPDDCVLLIKAHHLVSEQLDADSLPDNVRDMSWVEDINDLCVLASALITDYSSVLFDFAVTGRPMLFYCYDLEIYMGATRGLYLDVERDLPGPMVRDTAALVEELADLDGLARRYQARYAEFRQRFCALNDGQASRRVVEAVFGAAP